MNKDQIAHDLAVAYVKEQMKYLSEHPQEIVRLYKKAFREFYNAL